MSIIRLLAFALFFLSSSAHGSLYMENHWGSSFGSRREGIILYRSGRSATPQDRETYLRSMIANAPSIDVQERERQLEREVQRRSIMSGSKAPAARSKEKQIAQQRERTQQKRWREREAEKLARRRAIAVQELKSQVSQREYNFETDPDSELGKRLTHALEKRNRSAEYFAANLDPFSPPVEERTPKFERECLTAAPLARRNYVLKECMGRAQRQTDHFPHAMNALRWVDASLDIADRSEDAQEAQIAVGIAKELADFAISLTPAGLPRDVYEAISGCHALTGKKLDDIERGAALFGVATLGFGGPIAKAVKAAGNVVRKLGSVASQLGKRAVKFSPTSVKAASKIVSSVEKGEWSKIFSDRVRPSDVLKNDLLDKKFRANKGIPEHWEVKLSKETKKEPGAIYHAPGNSHQNVRVMPGNSNSPHPVSQKPYVVWKKDGKSLDKFGRPSTDPKKTHIPLEDFRFTE